MLGLNQRRALHIRGEIELQLVQLSSCLVAETVKLDAFGKRKIQDLLSRRPVELDTHLYTNGRYVGKLRLPACVLLV